MTITSIVRENWGLPSDTQEAHRTCFAQTLPGIEDEINSTGIKKLKSSMNITPGKKAGCLKKAWIWSFESCTKWLWLNQI